MSARFDGSEARTGLLLISPTALYTFLLLATPLAALLIYSLSTGGPTSSASVITVQNYATTLTDPLYRAIMVRTLLVSIAVTVATVIIAYPVAYFVSFNVRGPKKAFWLFLITIPFWTSYIIRVFLWKVILGYGGVVSSALEAIGVITGPMSFTTHATSAMIITLAHAYAPFAILPIFVALEKIDRSLLEAGQDLGETRLGTFRRVTLPLSMRGVLAAALIVFIPTVGDYVTPDLIGSGRYPMIANLVEVQLLKLNDRALGSAMAVVSMVVVSLASLIFLFMNRRHLRRLQ